MVKFLFPLIGILTIMVSCGCEDCTEPIEEHFVIINETGHTVKLTYWDENGNFYGEITNTDTMLILGYTIHGTNKHTHPLPFLLGGKDYEITVTYDDTISTFFGNPRKGEPYDIRSRENYFSDFGIYTYTLTEADYQYALEHREENE